MAILLVGCGSGLPSSLYTVSGVVTGLSGGTTVTLQNIFTTPVASTFSNEVKAISALSISDVSPIGASDVSFTFSSTLPPAATYNVVVSGQPTGGKTCTVANGSGKISGANIRNVTVTCGYTVGGSLSGLGPGKTVVLLNNGADALTLNANAASGITFASVLLNRKNYKVTVSAHPVGQGCRVANDLGIVSGVNITDVVTTCYDSGTLDPTFAASGIAVHNNAAGGTNVNDFGQSITTDNNDKILVAGYSTNPAGNTDMVIWRYASSGVLDTTFGSGGIVVHNNAASGGGNDFGQSITTDSTGEILVTGNSSNGINSDMVIWRYDSTGTLDTSFAASGVAVHNNAASGVGDDSGQSITTDSTGKILVTGSSANVSGNTDMVIWRYTSAGVLDSSFGAGGIVVNASAASGVGQSITTDPLGKILVTGYNTNSSGNTDMVIWRYTSAGVLDTSFGSGGMIVNAGAADGTDAADGGLSITTDANGKILVTGYSTNSSGNTDMVIWRYTNAGVLDTSFGTNGIVVHNNAAGGIGNINDYGLSITLDASHKIVVTGSSWNGSGNDDMVIWRYNNNGTLDTTFDTDGIVIQNNAAGGNGNDSGASITTDALGNILVTGHSTNSSLNEDMVIWRIIP